ncbi:MAG: glycosyltransferase family 39 protein [Gemmatimonadales bacterium]
MWTPLRPEEAPLRPAHRWAAIALIVGGAGLRLWQWTVGRSFWFDEATVAVGVLLHPDRSLLGAHEFGQVSPPLWLALVGLSTSVAGASEAAMRLPTLLASIGYLPALWVVLRRWAGARAALLGLGLAAVSPALLEYSAELKAYGADPLVSLALMALIGDAVRRDALPLPRAALYGLALGLLTWLSMFAIVVIVGSLTIVVAGRAAVRRSWHEQRLPGYLALAIIAALGFVLVYHLHYRVEPWVDDYLDRFWGLRFWSGGPPGLPGRIWASLIDVVSPLFFGHGGDLFPAVILLLMAIGLARSLARGPAVAALLAGPLAVWAVLALARQVPVYTRLGLFAAPLLTILLVSGWEAASAWLGQQWPRGGRWGAGLLAAWLLLAPASASVRGSLDVLDRRPNAGPVVRRMLERVDRDEPVYVYARAVPEWLYYSTDWTAPDRRRIGLATAEHWYPDGATFSNAPPRSVRQLVAVDEFRYRYRGFEEIYGQSSGFEQRAGVRGPRPVDPGWTAAEAGRMLVGEPRCVWLVVLHASRWEREPLLAELETRGYRRDGGVAGPRSRIDRVCRGS